MGVDVDVITKPEFDGRQRIVDERFARDKERINRLEEIQADMVRLNTQFAEIIKIERDKSLETSKKIDAQQDDINDLKLVASRLEEVIKTLSKNDEDKETRLSNLEGEPKNKLDKLVGWIGGGAIGAIVGYLMNVILH